MEPPSEVLLAWVRRQLGTEVLVERGLRQGASPWLLRRNDAADPVVLKITASDTPHAVQTEVAALAVAAAHGLPAPRLIAYDGTGTAAGSPALLESLVRGASRVPRFASTRRLRAAGAGLAALHAVALRPSAWLPLRTRPISASDFADDRRRTAMSSTPLLDTAADLIRTTPPPSGATVFVHGDMWHGNLLWHEERISGIVDWDMAGVGSAGIDVGAMRLDAALMYGVEAAQPVLEGWLEIRSTAGATPPTSSDIAYWDLLAAVNTPTDLARFVDAFRDQGRPDLHADVLNGRRDALLRLAMEQAPRR
ncbi:MAG TPA: phosphotransferase [Pseudonocardia sp.]